MFRRVYTFCDCSWRTFKLGLYNLHGCADIFIGMFSKKNNEYEANSSFGVLSIQDNMYK